jgi:hypothetical protein
VIQIVQLHNGVASNIKSYTQLKENQLVLPNAQCNQAPEVASFLVNSFA